MEFTAGEAVAPEAPVAEDPGAQGVVPDVDDLADEQPEPDSRVTPDVPPAP